ncbi:hypothetical protein BJV78DRAFT_1172431, partial [Lactifluus subvellereus]
MDGGTARAMTQNYFADGRVESVRSRRITGTGYSFGDARSVQWMVALENRKPFGVTAEPKVKTKLIEVSAGISSVVSDQG